MSEEAKIEIEYTEIEQKAMADGWIPPDRFEKAGKDKDFISAEKFLENGSFFRKINEQKKQIEELKETVSGVTDHLNKVRQHELDVQRREYENKIAELEARKVQALDEGDHSEVVKIDRQINNTEKPKEEIVDNSAFDSWVKDNSWYNEDIFLKREATKIGEQIARDEGLFGKQLFNEVSRHIKEAYPHKFENQNRNNAQTVEGGGNNATVSGKIATEKDLTPDEKAVYIRFDRMGTFKDDEARREYFKQVIELRD